MAYNTDLMTIVGNLIYNNHAEESGGVDLQPPGGNVGPFIGVIASNTIFGNTQAASSSGFGDAPASQVYLSGDLGQFLLVNNIIVGQGTGSVGVACGVVYRYLMITPLVSDHNDVYNPGGQAYGGSCTDQAGTYGNISADPLFVGPAAGNFQLTFGSPAIDSGNNSARDLLSTDLGGGARVQDATGKGYPIIDMGAYEFTGLKDAAATILTLTPSEYLSPGSSGFYVPPPLTFTVTLSSAAGTPTGPVTVFEDLTAFATVSIGPSGTATVSGASLPPGLHAFIATYPGTSSFQPAVSVKFYLYVPEIPSTLSLTSSPNPSILGSPVIFKLKASSGDGAIPSPVTLTDGLTQTVLATLTPDTLGAASYTTSSLAVGFHQVTAAYAGDTIHSGSSSSVLQDVIVGFPSTTTLACTPSRMPVFSTASLSTTVSSSSGTPAGSVTFADNGTTLGQATLLNGAASFAYMGQSTGTHTLTATYVPAGTLGGSSGSCSLVVDGLFTTATLAVTPTAAQAGAPVTLTASISSSAPVAAGGPTGTVTFLNGGVPVGSGAVVSGSSSLVLSTLGAGLDQLSCRYSGDSVYAGSACNVVPVQITAAPTALTVSASANPAGALTPVTFTVHLVSGTQPVAGATVSLAYSLPGGPPVLASLLTDLTGTGSYTTSGLTPGSYAVSASFAATGTQVGSSASMVEVVVADSTTTALAVSPNPAYRGQTVSLVATVSDGVSVQVSGSVTFLDGLTPLATVPVASGRAVLSTGLLAVGQHTLTASYGGSTSLLGSVSVPVAERVDESDFVLTSNPAALGLASGHHMTFTVTATSLGVFADELQLSMGGLPAHLRLEPKQLGELVQGGQTTASIYLDTDDVLGYLGRNDAGSRPGRGDAREMLAAASLPCLGLLMLGWRRGRLRMTTLLGVVFAAVLLTGQVGCSSQYPGSTAPGSYMLQITATAAGTQRTHTLAIPLTVTE